jgi:DNA-3-methyladenine glycosylase II
MQVAPKKIVHRKPGRVVVSTITTADDIRVGALKLRKLCPVMRRVHDLVGDPAPRRHAPGFAGLARVVVGQQLSEASARAIWTRTALAVDPFEADILLAMDVAALRAAGLSQGKIRTLRAAAEAVVSGALSFDRRVPVDDLRERLLAISGIGPWTADIYTLFCLGHADGFAAGDLALQVAAQRAFALEARPSAGELEMLAERWRPWRGVAALLLWAFYATRAPAA